MPTSRTFCQTYFELLDLPVSFEIDLKKLNNHYKALQREMHPDRFVGRSEHEQRLSVQYASFLNEALDTLKSPLKRAHYLLKLKGRDSNIEHYTIRDADYLMQQMQWRERLESVHEESTPLPVIEKLESEVETIFASQSEQFKTAYEKGDLVTAEEMLHKMHFAHKLKQELASIYDQFDG